MRIKFDSHQQYQIDAIQSVVDLFQGQPLAQGQFEIRLNATRGELFSELGIGNQLETDVDNILANLREVQERNGLEVSDELDGLNFSVEMETGTGKTYVYLRTIYELHQKYGFTKFIIVVPSVAIREGVLKNIELTRQHFADLYGNVPADSWIYDSKQVSRLRQFATSNQLQILIINIDAFNKKANNVIHREDDRLSGHKPIEFIQTTNPIVIVDEPQGMEGKKDSAGIASLNPMCTLRYSATHQRKYNLVYQLNPLKAYDLKLVKRIEVASVLDGDDFNRPYIQVKSITATSSTVTARVAIDVQGPKGPARKTITVRYGDDLLDRSNERENYRGYKITEISTGRGGGSGYVAFGNNVTVREGQTHGGQTDDLMRVQIWDTVKIHLEKELAIQQIFGKGERMKILSLFFIDRVANYVEDDGKIKVWFEKAYRELSAEECFQSLALPAVKDVHNGYFSQRGGKEADTSGKTKADDEAYALIMKEKDRLLQLDTPLRFIFSHSALREGWDNPNVFQICTLNESKSEMRKRQEIGRGLRLPVMENGERCTDPNVNCLTVIANESYADFAKALQTEIERETGVTFGDDRIKNRRERKQIRLRDDWRLNPSFQELWERINQKTRYSVRYSTEELIENAAAEIEQWLEVQPPKIRTERASIDLSQEGVSTTVRAIREAQVSYDAASVPDLLGYLQRETDPTGNRGSGLTRSTLAQILIRSGRLADVAINPQQFMDQAAQIIKGTMQRLMVDGIKYMPIPDDEYEMLKFEEDDGKLYGYEKDTVDVVKSIHNAIRTDSDVEYQFAKDLDVMKHIKLFIKLPRWFKVDTPMGTYNPDWAIVKESNGRDQLYLVAETKGTMNQLDLRGTERAKIDCGRAHFETLDVEYRQVTSAADL